MMPSNVATPQTVLFRRICKHFFTLIFYRTFDWCNLDSKRKYHIWKVKKKIEGKINNNRKWFFCLQKKLFTVEMSRWLNSELPIKHVRCTHWKFCIDLSKYNGGSLEIITSSQMAICFCCCFFGEHTACPSMYESA